MRWYFVCGCGAKWYGQFRLMRCPRCWHWCWSPGQQPVPWLNFRKKGASYVVGN